MKTASQIQSVVTAGHGLRHWSSPVKLAASCALSVSLVAMPFGARANVFEIGSGGAVIVGSVDPGTLAPDAQGALAIETPPDVPVNAITTIDLPIAPAVFQASLAKAADMARVSPALLAALVWQESRWRPAALSPKGARGLTQLMPGTAHALAVDPDNNSANLAGGARYLREMLDTFDGNVERALAAYNAGPGRVLRTSGVPAIAQTRAYVTSIIDRLGTGGSANIEGVKP